MMQQIAFTCWSVTHHPEETLSMKFFFLCMQTAMYVCAYFHQHMQFWYLIVQITMIYNINYSLGLSYNISHVCIFTSVYMEQYN